MLCGTDIIQQEPVSKLQIEEVEETKPMVTWFSKTPSFRKLVCYSKNWHGSLGAGVVFSSPTYFSLKTTPASVPFHHGQSHQNINLQRTDCIQTSQRQKISRKRNEIRCERRKKQTQAQGNKVSNSSCYCYRGC